MINKKIRYLYFKHTYLRLEVTVLFLERQNHLKYQITSEILSTFTRYIYLLQKIIINLKEACFDFILSLCGSWID